MIDHRLDLQMTNSDLLILTYFLGTDIITIKDFFFNLEPKIAELEKIGVKCLLVPADKEMDLTVILSKHGAKKKQLN
jgi:hypothetical protein